jgi:hypothetical protein
MGAFADAPFPFLREAKPMARTATRPKITVQAVYSGDRDMQETFVSLLVNEVRKGKCSVRTFENLKDTEYNLPITDIKEAR